MKDYEQHIHVHQFENDGNENGAASKADERLYRDALGRFSTGVAIVTALSHTGEKLGLTVNSFTSVSLAPPIILWCLSKDSECCSVFVKGYSFAVNVLAKDQLNLASAFSARNGERFNGVEFDPCSQEAPIIAACLAWFDCQVDDVMDGGDHWIITGRVHRFANRGGLPLLFQSGAYLR